MCAGEGSGVGAVGGVGLGEVEQVRGEKLASGLALHCLASAIARLCPHLVNGQPPPNRKRRKEDEASKRKVGEVDKACSGVDLRGLMINDK